MIYPKQIKDLCTDVDAELTEIERQMDSQMVQALQRDLHQAFLIVEDYPEAVLDRLPEVVEKYKRAGWLAFYSRTGHLMIKFTPEQRRK